MWSTGIEIVMFLCYSYYTGVRQQRNVTQSSDSKEDLNRDIKQDGNIHCIAQVFTSSELSLTSNRETFNPSENVADETSHPTMDFYKGMELPADDNHSAL